MSRTATQSRKTQRARREQARAAILAAATRMFAESGLAGSRTDAIAAAARVNKALIYYYFKSKDRLYAVVLEEQFRGFHEAALALLGERGSARAILLRYVHLHFDTINRGRRFAALQQQLLANAGGTVAPLIRKYALPRGEALRHLLERGIAEGEFRPVDVRHTMLSLTSLIVHYFTVAPIFQLVTQVDAYSEEELARRKQAVLDFIRHGLFLRPADPVP